MGTLVLEDWQLWFPTDGNVLLVRLERDDHVVEGGKATDTPEAYFEPRAGRNVARHQGMAAGIGDVAESQGEA